MVPEPVWTIPGPILEMVAKGLVDSDPGTFGHGWQVIGEWDDSARPTKTHKVRIKTDSGWVTIRRLEGT